ncbi:MAG: tetratricopeptide repeat protein [Acidobacteriota bacterium]|nr:tetratricopeptide repeat protein [Acidobacteriota bacterium]
MRYEFQKIRCQRCRAVNPLGQELCDKCGTRLMLVVEPTGLRYEEDQAAETVPPALMLERMTILESGLNRFAEKLERGFELMLRQAENIQREHLLVESLILSLVQSGLVSREEIERIWKMTMERADAERRESERREALRREIIADPPEEDDARALFYQYVGEGFTEIAAGNPESGLKKLEQASLFGSDNFALNTYIGEQHFRAGKSVLAADYFSRCEMIRPDDTRTLLLFGISTVDAAAQVEVGRMFINDAQSRQPSFAGHYALGRLAALDGDWEAARKEFSKALKLRRCPEAYFIYALAYFKGSDGEWNEKMALRYVRKALTMDADYREAYLLLGLLYRRAGEREKAREAFARATRWRARTPHAPSRARPRGGRAGRAGGRPRGSRRPS